MPNSRLSSRPVISSLLPWLYTSAVSKNVTPCSTALRTIGSAVSSSTAHARIVLSPKLIMPMQIRETLTPAVPNRSYFNVRPPVSPGSGRLTADSYDRSGPRISPGSPDWSPLRPLAAETAPVPPGGTQGRPGRSNGTPRDRTGAPSEHGHPPGRRTGTPPAPPRPRRTPRRRTPGPAATRQQPTPQDRRPGPHRQRPLARQRRPARRSAATGSRRLWFARSRGAEGAVLPRRFAPRSRRRRASSLAHAASSWRRRWLI